MHQYYVAIVLPEELNRLVLPHKEWMRDRFGCLVGLKSPAHITLLPPFWMNTAGEDSFRSEVDAFAKTQKPFTIHTAGFSSFKPRTLFIDVVVDDSLRQLKEECDRWFEPHSRFGIKFERRPFHPHITIATRDLPNGAFAEAWAHFERKPFDAQWTADALSILKHNGKGWEVLHRAGIGLQDS